MITTSTLKISLGLTLTVSLIAIMHYVSNENTQFETIENPITQSISSEGFEQRLIDTSLITHQPLLGEFIPPVLIEVPEEVVEDEEYDIVVYAPEVIQSATSIIRDEIISISHFGWTCNGGCSVICCSYEIIEEFPIEEEEESILSEQVFIDPYLFEAKAYPNPTRDNATIELEIEIGDNFTIQLFDLNGRLVEQIYDGYLESGRQGFNTNLNDFLPGLYFISIQSTFQQETLKLQKIN